MAEKRFLSFLGAASEDRMRCTFETRRGKVVRIKVVQYETLIRDKWIPVVRYDTAHGFYHRDVYLFGGRKHLKQIIVSTSIEEALTFAIQDIRRNWQEYKTTFLGKENGHAKI